MKMFLGFLLYLTILGCNTSKQASMTYEAMRDEVIMKGTRDVMLAGIKAGADQLPEAASITPVAGLSGYVKKQFAERDNEGNIALVDGKPIYGNVTGLFKWNNTLVPAGAIDKFDLAVLTAAIAESNTRFTAGDVDVFRLKIEGLNGGATPDGSIKDRYAGATAEKAAIYAGMSTLAQARGAAFAVGFTAMTDGMVQVLTATGTVIGKLNPTVQVIEAGVEGATSAISFLVDGKSFLAEGAIAEEVKAAVQ